MTAPVRDYRGVEVDVVGEGDLDDAVDAVGRVRADGGGRVRVVERDGVVRRAGGTCSRSLLRRDGADDGRAAPARELGRERADAAEDAVDQHGPAGDRAVGEHRPVGGDPRDPRQAPSSSLTSSGSSTACAAGTTVNWAAVPNGR